MITVGEHVNLGQEGTFPQSQVIFDESGGNVFGLGAPGAGVNFPLRAGAGGAQQFMDEQMFGLGAGVFSTGGPIDGYT